MVKLPLLKVLLIIKCGMLSFVQSQNLQISTRFMSGNVIFTWTPSNYSSYDVLITRDTTRYGIWTRVYDTQYTVRDVLLYDNITINVRTPGSTIYSRMTYNVFKIKTKVGDTVNVSLTAAFFPQAGQYNVYHTYSENRTIFSVRNNGVSYGGNNQSTKYTYLTRPFASINIMFAIRNITLDDAGYYNGGTWAGAAWSGGGVVLIVKGKHSKPKITGDLNVDVDKYINLTCCSKSTSSPDYYTKLVTLSYTWFVNETKIDREIRENLIFYVTRNLKYNRYTCTATEEDMESERSDLVQINPLYLDEPTLYKNSSRNWEPMWTTKENESLRVACFVDGNPTPTVRLIKGQDEIATNRDPSKWANYTATLCGDTDKYICEGSSSRFNFSSQTVNISITCKLRIDKNGPLQKNYSSTSGNNVKVVLAIPVIANPPPQASDITWMGPTDHPITSIVSQRDVVYKHWINTSVPINNHSNFGYYVMKYRNEIIHNITINAQDRPQRPLNFMANSYVSGYVHMTWTSGFNGGSEQFFILRMRDDTDWKIIANLTDPGKGGTVHFEHGPLTPGQEIWYRLESCNIINCSIQSVEMAVNVKDKPSKPKVTGDLNVDVNRNITLTCCSQSTSAPDYYSRLVTLSYTWFVNDTKISGETKDTLILYVTRDLKYNRYSCTATEHDLESDRSDPVQINQLYTSRLTGKGKMNIQELEMENLRLENTKLQKEIRKIEMETEVLQIKKNFYDVKLQMIRNEHPEVLAQMLKDNECE